jgi:hypothetical protein
MTTFGRTYDGNWCDIQEFPQYAISDDGRVVNLLSGNERKTNLNQQGIRMVILMRDGGRNTVMVAKLVADHFLSREGIPDLFDSVVHRNGDKGDCRVSNLVWRPRWFAVAYHRQFLPENEHLRRSPSWAVYLRSTDTVYETTWEAAIDNCMINMDIVTDLSHDRNTFPFGQWFEYIKPEDRERFGLPPAVGYEVSQDQLR